MQCHADVYGGVAKDNPSGGVPGIPVVSGVDGAAVSARLGRRNPTAGIPV